MLLAILPCFESLVMANTGGEPDVIPIKPKPDPDPNPGPRARSRSRNNVEVLPECFYYNGEVSIVAGSNIASISASVIRVNDNMEWSSAGMGNTLSFVVSTEPGTYVLMLTLSDGKSYYGEYTLY
ncbi:MAG: hypothetical protein J5596_01400 [Bacteroidaceae bacterium]|nr:hypothetical protein [Bacteroidaceae bacterium]